MRLDRIYWIPLSVTFIVFLVLVVSFTTDYTWRKEEPVNVGQVITSPPVPEQFYFAGEEVPLEYFDVLESLERELLVNTYWHSQTVIFIKKSSRYFPVIEPILKKNNIPDDFKYLAVIESGLSNAVSPSGAVGFWQILESTSQDYNLIVDNEVDERYHLEKATQAACRYLQESYNKYNSWTMTAASYNAGRRGIDRQITKQSQQDYYDLLLNSETARYVFRILAIKLILENPDKYGFNIPKSECYQPIKTTSIKPDSTITDLAQFAKQHHTNYKMIKTLNPWLIDNKLTKRKDVVFEIMIPKKDARNL